MLREILTAWCLVAVTVIIHAAGLAWMLRQTATYSSQNDLRFWPATRFLIRVAWMLIVLHMIEITVWAMFFWWQQFLPNAETSIYFAGVTYTTLGYGDVVLPQAQRLFGPIEALTGILMSGLSTGFFFAVLARLYAGYKPNPRSTVS